MSRLTTLGLLCVLVGGLARAEEPPEVQIIV